MLNVPDLHSSKFSLLVGLQIPQIAVDLDSTSHVMNVLQVFLALERGHCRAPVKVRSPVWQLLSLDHACVKELM